MEGSMQTAFGPMLEKYDKEKGLPELITPWPPPLPENAVTKTYIDSLNGVKERRKEGLRYDKGKIRYDLLEPFAVEKLAEVFTKGAEKYEPNNWLKGMKWSKMRASLGRHLGAFDKCQDYDIDPNCPDCKTGNCVNHTGLLHIAQVAWNAMALLSYYKHFPQGDDRFRKAPLKIGIDIDEVICNWVGAWCEKFGLDLPEHWSFHRNLPEKFEEMSKNGQLDDFYLGLKPLVKPSEIPFDIHCYVTSRSVPTEITEKWLDLNGFPAKKVITVGLGQSKVNALVEAGVDYFIDDRYDNYEEINRAGICCFLMDANHNRRFDVGYKRILSFKDFGERFLN